MAIFRLGFFYSYLMVIFIFNFTYNQGIKVFLIKKLKLNGKDENSTF